MVTSYNFRGLPDIEEMGRDFVAAHNAKFPRRPDGTHDYTSFLKTTSVSTHISTVQTQADLDISHYLLSKYRNVPGLEKSFSEEDDPLDERKVPIRIYLKNGLYLVQVDPGDGTGDARYWLNLTDGREARGVSILGSLINGQTPVAGVIYMFPDKKMLLGTRETGPRLYSVEGDELRYVEDFRRPKSDLRERVRVNYRIAYPDDDMLEFFKFLKDQKKLPLEVVELGGAGDSLGHLLMGNIDYVVTAVGNWKSWDIDPANGMEPDLKSSDLYGNPLIATIRHRIPWHQQGNIFTLDGDTRTMAEYRSEFERETGIVLRKDNR